MILLNFIMSLHVIIMLLQRFFPYGVNALKALSDAPSKGDQTGHFTNLERGAWPPFFTVFLSPFITNQDCFCDKQSPYFVSLFPKYNEEL